MIDTNSRIFSRLADAAGELVSGDLRRQKRSIRTNTNEKKWLKYFTIKSSNHLLIDHFTQFAIGEFEKNFYLIAIGIEVFDFVEELQPTELNAGAFTAITHELNIPIIRTADLATHLLEYIFYPIQSELELIDMPVVAQFFQKIKLYQISQTGAIAEDRNSGLRAALAAIIGSPAARPLEWPETALDRFSHMVRDPRERAPFHLLLRALTETRHDAAFLALYRCIEQLFPIPAISDLSADLGVSKPALGVAAAIEKRLGWRRREEDAIVQLFEELELNLIDRIITAVGEKSTNENKPKFVAKRIYDLRNQCVHFRPTHAINQPLTISNWPAFCDLMLEAVQNLYGKYAAAFDCPQ